jgi:hypothetical protein
VAEFQPISEEDEFALLPCHRPAAPTLIPLGRPAILGASTVPDVGGKRNRVWDRHGSDALLNDTDAIVVPPVAPFPRP